MRTAGLCEVDNFRQRQVLRDIESASDAVNVQILSIATKMNRTGCSATKSSLSRPLKGNLHMNSDFRTRS